MAYVPIDDASFKAVIAGDSTMLADLCANDRAAFENYAPGLEANPYPLARTDAREFRFRWRGNIDPFDLTVGVRAVATGAAKTVTIATPGVWSDTVSVTTDAWYSATVVMQGPDQEVIVSAAAPSPDTLAVSGLRASVDQGSGGNGPNGYRRPGLIWGVAGMSVPSDIISTLRTNPIRLAIDRPVCVACHISDTVKTVSTKSLDIWGVENSTDWKLVGKLVVPLGSDRSPRWYRVDAYTAETVPGTGEFSVRIGATDERWTGPGWHSWRVRLGYGQHTVTATVKAGNPNEASIRTLQVWRSEL